MHLWGGFGLYVLYNLPVSTYWISVCLFFFLYLLFHQVRITRSEVNRVTPVLVLRVIKLSKGNGPVVNFTGSFLLRLIRCAQASIKYIQYVSGSSCIVFIPESMHIYVSTPLVGSLAVSITCWREADWFGEQKQKEICSMMDFFSFFFSFF